MSSENGDVFLATCDGENFDRSVRTPVELAEFEASPDALAAEDAVRFWGASDTAGNRTYFEKMDPGDLVLFYDGEAYVGVGRVGTTVEDDDGWAKARIWQASDATLLYTVEGFSPIEVSTAALNRIFDYDSGYTPSGLIRIADARVTNDLDAIKLAVESYTSRQAE